MSEYRFHLQKYKQGNKLSCPECGMKKCFVKYIDEEGKIIFPDSVGKCDHVNRCGYHYTPKEYFHEHPDLKPGSQSQVCKKEQAHKQKRYCSKDGCHIPN